MKATILAILKSLFTTVVTERFIIWAMRILVEKTTNKWGLAFVDIVEAGITGDEELLKKGLKDIAQHFRIEI